MTTTATANDIVGFTFGARIDTLTANQNPAKCTDVLFDDCQDTSHHVDGDSSESRSGIVLILTIPILPFDSGSYGFSITIP